MERATVTGERNVLALWPVVDVLLLHGQILRREGWRGLFQGLQASLLGTAVSQGVYFYFYSLLRQFFVARHQRLTSSRSQVHTYNHMDNVFSHQSPQ